MIATYLTAMMTLLNLNPSQHTNSAPLTGKPVHFQIVINEKSITRPVIVIHNETYCDMDFRKVLNTYIQPCKKEKNHYYFEIPDQQAIKYFSIMVTHKAYTGKMPTYLLENYHFEPGDNVLISLDPLPGTNDDDLNFSGQGSAKYRCLNEYEGRLMLNPPPKGPIYTKRGNYNPYNQFTVTRDLLLEVVDKFEPEISEASYNLLRMDIMAKQTRELVDDFYECIAMALENNDMQAYERMSADYRERANVNTDFPGTNSLKYFSREYAQLMVRKIACDYLDQYQRINYSGVYIEIMKIENAALRDKMTVAFFILYKNEANFSADQNSVLDHALSHIQDKDCLKKMSFYTARR